MKTFFFTLFSIVSLLPVSAQVFTVKGQITDASKNPVPYANVLLLNEKDSLLVKGGVTDDKGNFEIETNQPGKFRIMTSYTGMKKTYTESFDLNETSPSAEVGTITLGDDAVALEEAVIVAQKPFIEHHLDKTIVNVENSIIAAGSTALEVLQRSPGVIVDKDDNITLKGRAGVTIMIDGKPTYLSQQDVAAMLKSLPADQLEKIEIITNPSAKFDAAGTAGILNIVLKKNKNYGWNGRVSMGGGSGYYDNKYGFGENYFPSYNGGLNLNYRAKKWNAFVSYNHRGSKGFDQFIINRKFRDNEVLTSIFDQTSDMLESSNTHSGKIGLDYFVNDKHTIGFFVNGMRNTDESEGLNGTYIKDAAETAMSSSLTSSDVDNVWQNFTVNLNYMFKIDTTGKELTANIDFAQFDNNMNQYYRTDYYDSSGANMNFPYILKSKLPSFVDIKSAKLDYIHPIGKKMKFESGVKSSYVTTDNNAQFWYEENGTDFVDTTKTNHFKYTENINAAYANFGIEFNDKWNTQAGLRFEQTNALGEQITTDSTFRRKYYGLFPSAFLTYKASMKHEWNLTYSRRIDRPDYQDLNPFIYFLDPYTYMQGNTLLLPQYTNSFELTHTFMSFLSTTINYSHTSDVMTMITKQVDSTFSTFATTENLSSQDNFGLAINVPVPLSKWWTSINYINGFYNRFRGTVQGAEFDKGIPAWMINSQNMFNFKKGWSAELSAFYMSRQVYGIFVMDPMSNITIGIQKTILKDKGTLKLSFNDIFWKSRWNSDVQFQNMDMSMQTRGDSRSVNINFSYKFGNAKAQYQRKESGASDELDRVKQGGN